VKTKADEADLAELAEKGNFTFPRPKNAENFFGAAICAARGDLTQQLASKGPF
jgi:hypothetical protein